MFSAARNSPFCILLFMTLPSPHPQICHPLTSEVNYDVIETIATTVRRVRIMQFIGLCVCVENLHSILKPAQPVNASTVKAVC